MLKNNIEIFAKEITQANPQCEQWLEAYTTDFETQINIDPTGLEEAENGWIMHDGTPINHIRIPYKSNSNEPTWRDRLVRGHIHDHWAYFGTSGWNWAERKSYWVGFDFDSLTNHTEGLTQDNLEEVKNRALSLDYVTARTSKSGKGIHLLVYLAPKPITRNHSEHSDLAKHVLDRMSDDCGFNFRSAADCCGLILWHWQKGLKNDCCRKIDF